MSTSQMLTEARVNSPWEAPWDDLWDLAYPFVIYLGIKDVENWKSESLSTEINRKIPSPGFIYQSKEDSMLVVQSPFTSRGKR